MLTRSRAGGREPGSKVARHTSATFATSSSIDSRKCMITQAGARSKMTVKPPHTACAATPSGSSAAISSRSRRNGRRRHAIHTASRHGMATTLVIIRLPNSISVWVLSSGVKLVPLQRGQSEQPRPEPVSRTAAPREDDDRADRERRPRDVPELTRGERTAEEAHQGSHCGNHGPYPGPMPKDAPITTAIRGRRFADGGIAESWNEPSRFGAAGLLARRAVQRAGRPIASRQERVTRDLAGALEGVVLTAAAATLPPVLDAASVVDVESVHGPIFMHRNDEVMTPQVQQTGRWEPAEERFLLAELRPGDTFVDVGANVGYFSVVGGHAVTETGHVVSVEAEQRNVALLRANLWRHGLHHVAVLPMAAGARADYLRLAPNEANRGDHQVHSAAGADSGTLVPAGRLDEVLRGLEVDVVKIDTQGGDHDVVEGLRGLFRPGLTLLVEFWLEGMADRGVDPHAVVAGYVDLGLGIELLTDDGVVPTTAEAAVATAAGWAGQWVNLVLRVR